MAEAKIEAVEEVETEATLLSAEELVAKRTARKAARAAIAAAGFEGQGKWLFLRRGAITFEAKGRTDGKIQLFAATGLARRFVQTVTADELQGTLDAYVAKIVGAP